MTAMDQAIDNVAPNVFGHATNAAAVTPDGLGTTFHESGTLRMGDDPTRSAVNGDGQFHYVTNLYAGDGSVLPTCGSANPVMNGIAIRRRLASVWSRRARPTYRLRDPRWPAAYLPLRCRLPASDRHDYPSFLTAARLRTGACRDGEHFTRSMALCSPYQALTSACFGAPSRCRRTIGSSSISSSGSSTRTVAFLSAFPNPELAGFANNAWSAVYRGFEIQIDNSGAGRPSASPGRLNIAPA